ncbi:MAG: ketoacyl-ACP synthase III [Verrucomicrobia bacterium]|nr:ketoacyl-ACP synthase III [Verrucomicrobiota bacterium]
MENPGIQEETLHLCRIAGTGSYVPERVVTNADFEKIVDTSDAWIVERTGIRERRFAAENEFTSDMATAAARKAIKNAGITAEDVDLIIVASVSPDNIFPSTAARVQNNLGAVNAIGFDLESACAGLIYGIEVGKRFIATGFKNILVIGAEKLSGMVDMQDRNTCILFGDGAGAVILQRANQDTGRILATELGLDGSRAEMLQVPAGGCRLRPTHEVLDARQHYMAMRGKETFRYAVTYMVDCARKVFEKANCLVEKLTLAIPHQANLRIIRAAAERLGLRDDQVFLNVAKYGNTSSASVGIALDEDVTSGKIHRGDIVLLVAFGSGFSWGAVLLEW